MQPLCGPSHQALQQQCAPVKYIIFDEISMIGSDLMNAIDSRMCQAFPAHVDVVFGGCSVIFLLNYFGHCCVFFNCDESMSFVHYLLAR